MADRISANKQDEIVRLYHDGLKIREIANAVGVGPASVFNVLERRGIKPNRQPRTNGEESISVSQLMQQMLALEREKARLETRNRRLEAEVARLRLAAGRDDGEVDHESPGH